MRTDNGGYRRDHLRALAQRVEVDVKEVRIIGSKGVVLRTLVSASSAKTAGSAFPVLYRSGAPEGIRTPEPSSSASACFDWKDSATGEDTNCGNPG
jgi:hypothetical protein